MSSNLYDKYRAKVTEAEENFKVDSKCMRPCDIQSGSGISCKSTLPQLAPYFEGRKPGPESVVPEAFRERMDQYRCWVTLPALDMGVRPPTLKSPEEIRKMVTNSECFDCRRKVREDLQAGMVYSPDARFWIGVGAASAGVLVALMVAITRR